MKTREEIEKIKKYGFKIFESHDDGGCGAFCCAPFIGASVVWTFLDRHVSVCPRHETPKWEDMCKLKDLFFNDEDEVWQCHPRKTEYVNIMENCLHLWEGKLVQDWRKE